MRRLMGGCLVLAVALAVPTFAGVGVAQAKTKAAKASDDSAAGGTAGMSKEDQDKLKEHNKLRAEIKKVKYPAAKGDVVAHVKGVKADDKKWFEQTLPDRTYNSPDEVFSALGWETATAEGSTGAAGAGTASGSGSGTASKRAAAGTTK
jgi:hypothetical protein